MDKNFTSKIIEKANCLKAEEGRWINGEALITKKELGTFFQMDPDNAHKFCIKHNVLPINVGQGKVARLRWLASQVTNLLTILQASSTKPQNEFRPRRKGDAHILGRSVRELHKELSCA